MTDPLTIFCPIPLREPEPLQPLVFTGPVSPIYLNGSLVAVVTATIPGLAERVSRLLDRPETPLPEGWVRLAPARRMFRPVAPRRGHAGHHWMMSEITPGRHRAKVLLFPIAAWLPTGPVVPDSTRDCVGDVDHTLTTLDAVLVRYAE